jgi:hypothetical protein
MVRLKLDRRLQGRVAPSDVLQEAYLDLAARLPDYARDRPMSTYPGCGWSPARSVFFGAIRLSSGAIHCVSVPLRSPLAPRSPKRHFCGQPVAGPPGGGLASPPFHLAVARLATSANDAWP